MAASSPASLLLFRSTSRLPVMRRIFLPHRYLACPGFHPRVRLSFCVPTVLFTQGTGISTCCPSTTTLVLALGPDLPRADQLYSGNLGYSAAGILTLLSLLIPAFSLHDSPLLLISTASSCHQCSSTNACAFHGFGVVFQPRTFSAQDLSTSELLRTLLMYGCF